MTEENKQNDGTLDIKNLSKKDKERLNELEIKCKSLQDKLDFEVALNSSLKEILREKIGLIIDLEMEKKELIDSLERSRPILITNLDGKIIKV